MNTQIDGALCTANSSMQKYNINVHLAFDIA